MNVSDTMQTDRLSPPAAQGMVHIPGGVFRMGSDAHYPEEAPSHLVKVDEFWIDETPVTNRAFARFVNATGYRQLSPKSRPMRKTIRARCRTCCAPAR